MKNIAKNSILFFLTLIVVLICIAFSYVSISSKAANSTQDEIELKLKVPLGMSAREVSNILAEKSIIKNKNVFYFFARFPTLGHVITGKDENIFTVKKGNYNLKSSMNLGEIYEIISSGKEDSIKVVLPEGLTLLKIAQILENNGICKAENFVKEANSEILLKEYKIVSTSFEGYLFPDTYFFVPGKNPSEYIRQMADNFFEKGKSIPNFLSLTPDSLNQKVILASIIEREYRREDEASIIASVFVNRLNHDIGLYSCATIEYIITEIKHRPHPDVITYADLDLQSPYNTYKNAGLPPGAISNPGMVALNAAINPAQTDFYYFRLIDAEKGIHYFSKDFQSHVDHASEYATKSSAGK